jgi:predicted phosphate transport protein (TIGR00153 family)
LLGGDPAWGAQLVAELTASDKQPGGADFGRSVGISGDYIVVGAGSAGCVLAHRLSTVKHADRIIEGAQHLVDLMQQYGDASVRQQKIDAIDVAETSADKITHETMSLLHKTFITPFDRDDIHALISRMDDILDLTQDVAESVMLSDLQRVTPEAIQLATLSQMCCERVKAAVGMLQNMENADAILKVCQEIDQLESDADRVMRAAMSKLFRDESDVRQLIKLKAIYELLETITDRCEDVANLIEGVVLENA